MKIEDITIKDSGWLWFRMDGVTKGEVGELVDIIKHPKGYKRKIMKGSEPLAAILSYEVNKEGVIIDVFKGDGEEAEKAWNLIIEDFLRYIKGATYYGHSAMLESLGEVYFKSEYYIAYRIKR